jgi:holliday junction DNA helicase RuvA
MIAKLYGIVENLKPTELILNVNNVGYQVFIPISTFENLTEAEEVVLYIHTIHKEDQFNLYGFIDLNSKKLFSLLIKISGIGPSIALSLLSGITLNDLIESIINDDIFKLIKIPGIGKSKAEKLIFELKRKRNKIEELLDKNDFVISSSRSDAIEALIILGFDEKKSSLIIDELLNINSEELLESLIKQALKILSK